MWIFEVMSWQTGAMIGLGIAGIIVCSRALPRQWDVENGGWAPWL